MSESFTDNDIRPDNLKDGQWEAQKKDIAYLHGLQNHFVKVCCPACGKDDYEQKFEKYSFQFDCCNNCGTLYMNPRASEDDLKQLYTNSEVYAYWNKYIFPASDAKRNEKIFKPRVERIIKICEKYNIGTDLLVEVGAGYGSFMRAMQQVDYFKRLLAVEPFSGLAEHCRSVGVDVIEDTIENVDLSKDEPDIIVCFEVIEHLFSPVDFLKACFKSLESGGILILSCPNYAGFDISLLQEVSDSIDEEHINLFTPESIKILAERAGFKLLEIMTPGELDAEIVRNKILKSEFELEDKELKEVLIEQWEEKGRDFQKSLQKNKQSSHMWTVVQKI